MKTGYIIIDIGTGNTRAGLFTDSGECLAVNTVDTEYVIDTEYDDACYFVPNQMFSNILKVTKRCIDQVDDIKIIGMTATSQRQGIVLIDKEGESYLGLPNIDNRGKAYVEEIGNQERIYQLSGRWARKYFSAYKLYGLNKVKSQEYQRIWKITSISDWVGYMFTGELCYEPSQACETQLFDTKKLTFSKELCDIFDVSMDILPEVKNSGKLLGIIKSQLARELGITHQIPFVVGGGDTQFAVKGVNAKSGDLVITAGTTTPVTYLTDHYFADEKQRCWVDCHIDTGTYVIETNVGVTGLNYQNLKKVFFPDKTYNEIGCEMDITQQPKCVCSLSTMDFAKGEELGKGGFSFSTPVLDLKPSDFAYSILFGMACGIKDNVEAIETITGKACNSIVGCGGGFNGDLFAQIVSNLLKKKVILKKGFSQASGQGGVNILNGYFGNHTSTSDKIYKEYLPMDLPWCEKAFEDWKTLKSRLNS